MGLNATSIEARIREARENLRLTQIELAEQAGASKNTIPRYERGEVTNLSLEIIHSIAKVLGVRVDWLCDGTG